LAALATSLIVLTLAATGCDAGRGENAEKEELDLRNYFGTLSELEVESTDVVKATPTGESRTEGEPNLQFAVTELTVDSAAVDGTVKAGESIYIRQPVGQFSNIAPVLDPDPDTSYIAYIKPWTTFESDHAYTGQFVIVGEQGVWRVRGEGGVLASPGSRLPRRIAISESDGILDVSAR